MENCRIVTISTPGLTPAEILTTTKSEYTTLFSGGDGGHIYSWLQGVFAVIDNQASSDNGDSSFKVSLFQEVVKSWNFYCRYSVALDMAISWQ